MFELLYDDGIYLCEDVHTSYMPRYYDYGERFIDYVKRLVDHMHSQHMEDGVKELLSDCPDIVKTIKSISFYDSLVFISKKCKTGGSIVMKT